MKNQTNKHSIEARFSFKSWRVALVALAALLALPGQVLADFTLTVVDGATGVPVPASAASPIRWLAEEDNTTVAAPGQPTNNSISLVIFKSHAPVLANGSSTANPAVVNVPNTNRYVLSVMVKGYALGGGVVTNGQSQVTVAVNKHAIPTAQITVIAFVDHDPINNAIDEMDPRLGGCEVLIDDTLGQVTYDAFGNPLGTRYKELPDGTYEIEALGSGKIYTLSQRDIDTGNNPHNLKLGEAVIKNLPPNKYGCRLVPPNIDDNGQPLKWIQTATIEGTLTIDAWVAANEPSYFVEGFGTGFKHVAFGFVKTAPTTPSPVWGTFISGLPWNQSWPAGGGATVRGTLRYNHFSKPPNLQGYFPGAPVNEGWFGLNDPNAIPEVTQAGLYAGTADPDTGYFELHNVPPGDYQLVTWDKPLDALFGVHMNNPVARATFSVTNSETIDLGNVLCFRWFGTLEGSVFYDADQDGFRDAGEQGIPLQNINLRFRDGTIYQTGPTDIDGNYEFAEVFPFFKWLVAEVDFARFKATGMTMAADEGGPIPDHNGWTTPSYGKLNPQPQYATDPVTGVADTNSPVYNPNTGNNLSRTETGPVLTTGMHLFLGQANAIDWGKVDYAPGENGGISGIAVYSVTRAEEDPREAATDPWESGVPRVQFALYADANADKMMDDADGDGQIELADVDNHPLGWAEGGVKGAEDVDLPGNGATGVFSKGDALQVVWSDSWDDVAAEPPQTLGAIQTQPPVILGKPIIGCDNFGTWNQIRPEVFDGGYAFNDLTPGMYIVQSCPPPGYLIQTEESINVTFGDEFVPSKLAALPECVGTRDNHANDAGDAYVSSIVPKTRSDAYTVAQYLSLFPEKMEGAPFAGEVRPLADMKWVRVADGRNAAADFHLYTEVPKAARCIGFVLNDLGAEFNQASPNFGEKLAVPWIPIAIRDWTGKEIQRVYSDEYGTYNALVPGTYTANAPNPKGLSVNMLTIVLNDPLRPDGTIDPFYNPMYVTAPWTFHFISGSHSYLDTPIVPVAGFTTAETRIDTEPADGTPMIRRVDGPEDGLSGPAVGGGPWIRRTGGSTTFRRVTITAMGPTAVINPDYDSTIPGSPMNIIRDYGFGNVRGTVTLCGVPLTVPAGAQYWTPTTIVVNVPANMPTGELLVTRSNGKTTPIGVTLHLVENDAARIHYVPAEFPTIQAAIDAATTLPGDLILVAPGNYNENVVMNKPVKLQGFGAGSTAIFGNPNPVDRLQAWHDRVNALGAQDFATFLMKDPFQANEAPVVLITGEIEYPAGTLQIPQPGMKVLNPGYPFTKPSQALLDGFRLNGSKAGGGVFVLGGARYLQISNNKVDGNQGWGAGGFCVGEQDTGFDCQNDNVLIRRNWLARNSGVQGAGGISVNEAADNYVVEDNTLIGNFSSFNGAGFNHRGLCLGTNIVRRNKILFNEDFYAALLMKAGDGGGIFVSGGTALAGATGAGNVILDGNHIQGNVTGSGNGGGICISALNATDVTLNPLDPTQWYWIDIINNVIVNNVAGAAGGGISLQDALRARIEHNTIAHNDSTATSRLVAPPTGVSTPQGAGIVVVAHSPMIFATLGTDFTSPTIANNIIYNNRSFYHDPAGYTNGWPTGGLVSAGVSDLTVKGTTGTLAVNNCLLTAAYPGPGNIVGDPLFLSSYTNSLESTIVVDEMGNNINVRFTPLKLGASDYHIAGGSPAVNTALANAVDDDFDRQYRPAGAAPDIGADEAYTSTVFAVNDRYSVNEGSTLAPSASRNVLGNDSGASPRTAVLIEGAKYGTLTLFANGRFRYIPAPDFNGKDWFSYRAMAGAAGSAEAYVCITVNPVADRPVANWDTFAIIGNPPGGSLTTTIPAPGVLANDSDAEGSPLTAVYVSGPTPNQGSLTLNSDGSFTFTPNPGYVGIVDFRYRAHDGTQPSNPSGGARVRMNVEPPQADFVVTAFSIDPHPVSGGSNMTARVTVKNQGSVAGDAGMLTIWLNMPGVDVPAGTPGDTSVAVGNLLAGEEKIIEFAGLTAPMVPPPVENQVPPVIFRAFVNSALTPEQEFSVLNNQLAQSYLVTAYAVPSLALPMDEDEMDTDKDGDPWNDVAYAHVSGGDGFARMADGNELYTFGFSDFTARTHELAAAGAHPDQLLQAVMAERMLKAEISAPTYALKEGQRFYFDLSNVGMLMRPDLFDPHTIHFHGYPQAASIFDGEPFASIAVNVGATFRYYYQINDPGTYIYHCHMEATEHMEMGMLGTVYVLPKQNYLAPGTTLTNLPPGKGTTHQAGYKYVYNDGDGSTYYDKEFPIQIGGFDRYFHELHIAVQPLPFASLDETYPLINGRGYPDTVNPGSITNTSVSDRVGGDPYAAQKISSLVTAAKGEYVLLRLSSVALCDFHTIRVDGIPMRVVGKDANLLRGPTGKNLSYQTTSVTLGGGEMGEVILDTTNVTPGTYFLYDTRLNHLCNSEEDFGGMMTEIIITP